MSKNDQPKLSIIILNYNTQDITIQAIESIEKNYPTEVREGVFEIIVTDNASPDGSLETFSRYQKKTSIKLFHVIDNGANIGFSAGNNKGVFFAKGKYILFLNPDTITYAKTLNYMLDFMDHHPNAGAASCKLINKNGNVDFNCHRGFPTPWNSFCYFSGLQKLFPHNKIFAGYTQGWKNLNTTHEVDAIEGAFVLIPRKIGEEVGWWNEDYFFNGEDLQLCFDIKKLGYKIYYVGEVSIMHIGGAASGVKTSGSAFTTANTETKTKVQSWRFDAMRKFYKKNYANSYPFFINWLVLRGIDYLYKKTLPRI